MQFCLKSIVLQIGLWHLVVAKRTLDCHDLKGEGALLQAVKNENITIECHLHESIKQCVWTPQNSSYSECSAPMTDESSIIFAHTRPNYICSFRPSHCSISFTAIQRENMGVWTLATVSSTNAYYQYFAMIVRNTGVIPRSLAEDMTDSSCYLTDTIFQTESSVFEHLDEVESPEECQVKCQEIGKCTHWTWADSQMKSLSKHCFLRSGDDAGLGKERRHFVSGPKYCSDLESNLRRFPKTLRPPKEGVNGAKFGVTTLMISAVVAVVLVLGVMASLVRRYSQRTERDYNSLDLAVDVGQPIPVAKLGSLVQRKVVPLPKEFKRLTDLDRAKNIIAKSREVGKSKLNISLNRIRHVLPYDECRLILSTKIEESDYINASIMPGTPDIGSLIACQIPSNEVEDHYWQMVVENPICVVVNLDENSLWATNANNMNVQLRSGTTIILKEHWTQTNKSKSMTKTSYRFNSRQVEHFSYNAWNKHQIPKDLSTFCSLIESVTHLSKAELNHSKGSILVQCDDGSSKSGFFIACLVLAYELGMKSEISVYKTVFALRECRSHVVPTELQYRAVYEVVSMLAKIYKRNSSKRKSSVRATPSSSIITTV